jgi:hypothetical protein
MSSRHRHCGPCRVVARRGDLFEKRRRMMNEWAMFLAKIEDKGELIAPAIRMPNVADAIVLAHASTQRLGDVLNARSIRCRAT